ncbi:MAG: nitrous oxide reductase family maturation protein NosD [Gemmatimonadota bacterium]|nr:nitrous oxide reductase family maturation protein NosD [Gemmatimonadota bacterium]
MIAPLALALLQAAVLTVGPTGAFRTVTAALAAAAPGDTIRVAAGVYREHPVLTTPVVLIGEPGAILDGGLAGTLLRVEAPATIRGLTFRRSGRLQAEEHAGILAERADGLVIEDCRFEEVLFGIYIKESHGVIIRHNEIIGKDFPVALRGDGIRLWSSHDGRVEDNHVARVRDLVIWFSNGTVVRGNVVRDSRYGLHFMYSRDNRFEDNAFLANHVGAFIMYSQNITFRNNLFAAARGTTGRGLGFKDSDGITAERNVLVKNAVGLSLDNSPTTAGVRNAFRDNLVAYNDVGVLLLPSVHSNDFVGNAFRDNLVPVRVTGGGTAQRNQWKGNYWSDYAGFDENRDGVGDTPYRYDRLSDDLLARHDELRLFAVSPATTALDLLSRVLPLLAPEAIIVDSAPVLQAPRADAPPRGSRPVGILLAVGLTVGAGAAAWRLRRPFGRAA